MRDTILNLRITTSDKMVWTAAANREGRSLSNWIRWACDERAVGIKMIGAVGDDLISTEKRYDEVMKRNSLAEHIAPGTREEIRTETENRGGTRLPGRQNGGHDEADAAGGDAKVAVVSVERGERVAGRKRGSATKGAKRHRAGAIQESAEARKCRAAVGAGIYCAECRERH